MITEDKVIEIFCIMDEFCKNFASECDRNFLLEDKTHRHRNRKGQLSHSEIMTIPVCCHFGSFANFKHYYLFYIRQHLSGCFRKQTGIATCTCGKIKTTHTLLNKSYTELA